jgi:hypothetical protein
MLAGVLKRFFAPALPVLRAASVAEISRRIFHLSQTMSSDLRWQTLFNPRNDLADSPAFKFMAPECRTRVYGSSAARIGTRGTAAQLDARSSWLIRVWS